MNRIAFRSWLLGFVAIFLMAFTALAQNNFVFTNNDTIPNTVSVFSVKPNGSVTEVVGSPFLTGGMGMNGGYYAANHVNACIKGDYLFVANGYGTMPDFNHGIATYDNHNSVSVFTVNPTSGVITPVAGSPFISDGFGEISLTITPNGKFLYVAHIYNNMISAYKVNAGGILSPVAGSPFFIDAIPDGVKVTPNGKFLCVAEHFGVGVYAIGSEGALSAVPGSPFFTSTTHATGVEINTKSNLVFVPQSSSTQTTVDVFTMATNGALTMVTGSPFVTSAINSNVALLSTDDKYLFVSNQFNSTITVFAVADNGVLTEIIGSPFPIGINGMHGTPAGMALNRRGNLLYVATMNMGIEQPGEPLALPNSVYGNGVVIFSIGKDGKLTLMPSSPKMTGQPGYLLSIAAWPANPRSLLDHNTIYVADTGNNRVMRSFDLGQNWESISPPTGLPSQPGHFLAPRGVAASYDDSVIFVADTQNNRIHRSTDGGATWGLIATSGKVLGPRGLAFDEVNDRLYVADTGSSRILVSEYASTALYPVFNVFAGATSGSTVNRVFQPRAVAVDREGLVYVADTGNNRILINRTLATNGWEVYANTTLGTTAGKVKMPSGIYVDALYNVFVADTGNSRIMMNTTGTSAGWKVMMTGGSSATYTYKPEGVVFNNNGFIGVADTGNDRCMKKWMFDVQAAVMGGIFKGPTAIR